MTSDGQRIGISFWATHVWMAFRRVPVGRFVIRFRSIARGRCRSSHTREEVLRIWGNAPRGNPCDEIHRSEFRSPGSFRRRRAFFASTTCRSEERPSLCSRSRGGADAHRYRREDLKLADSGLASCENVSGSAHPVARAIGWARAVLVRCSTTAAGVRKPSKVNIGGTTPKA